MGEFDDRIDRIRRERAQASRAAAERAQQQKASAMKAQVRAVAWASEMRRLGRAFAIEARTTRLVLVTIHVTVGTRKDWWYGERPRSERRQAWDIGDYDEVSPGSRERGYTPRRLFVEENGDIWIGRPGPPPKGPRDPGAKGPYNPGGVEPIPSPPPDQEDALREKIADVLAAALA